MFRDPIRMMHLILFSAYSLVASEAFGSEYELIPLFSSEYSLTRSPVINSSGYVIGEIYDKKNNVIPFVYHDSIGFKPIMGLKKAYPKMINNHGVVVGIHHNSKSSQIFLYDVHSNSLTDLKTQFSNLAKRGLLQSEKQDYAVHGISDDNILTVTPEAGDSFIYDFNNREILHTLYSLYPGSMDTQGYVIGWGFREGYIIRWIYDPAVNAFYDLDFAFPKAVSNGYVIGEDFGYIRAYVSNLDEGTTEIILSGEPAHNQVKNKASISCEHHLHLEFKWPFRYIQTSAVNSKGVVVGLSGPNEKDLKPYIYKAGMGYELGSIDEMGSRSSPIAINIHDQVVGLSNTPRGSRAFIWDWQNGMRDLTQLIPEDSGWEELSVASSISDQGYIVGMGKHNGQECAFLLKPFQTSD